MNTAHLPLEHHRAPVSWSRQTAALVVATAFAVGVELTIWAVVFFYA
jgi:hypothetical protein